MVYDLQKPISEAHKASLAKEDETIGGGRTTYVHVMYVSRVNKLLNNQVIYQPSPSREIPLANLHGHLNSTTTSSSSQPCCCF